MRIFKLFHYRNGTVNQHLLTFNWRTNLFALLVITLFRFILQFKQIVNYLLHVLIDKVMLIVVDFDNLSHKDHPVKQDNVIDEIAMTDPL